MTKTLNQIFFPPPKTEYFFQHHWESEYYFRRKPYGFYGFTVAVAGQRALHTENSGFSLQLWVSTFPRFVAI